MRGWGELRDVIKQEQDKRKRKAGKTMLEKDDPQAGSFTQDQIEA